MVRNRKILSKKIKITKTIRTPRKKLNAVNGHKNKKHYEGQASVLLSIYQTNY